MLLFSRTRRTRAAIAMPIVLFLMLAGPVTLAAIWLNPGKLSGTIGLASFEAERAEISLSGNPTNFSGQITVTGDSFTLITEGNQVYDLLQIVYRAPETTFSQQSRKARFIQAGRTLSEDFRRESGAIINTFSVTGGEVVSAELSAVASDPILNETYHSLVARKAGGSARLPMVTNAEITIAGSLRVLVLDGKGVAVCTASLSLPQRRVSLSAGEELEITHELTATEDLCRSGLSGKVEIRLPGAIDFDAASVWASGRGGESFLAEIGPNGSTYNFSGVPPTSYQVTPVAYYRQPNAAGLRGYLWLPNADPNEVTVEPHQPTVRDFVTEGVLVQGTANIDGFGASRWTSNWLIFVGDYSDVSTRSGMAQFATSSEYDRTYTAALTPGRWRSPYSFFGLADVSRELQLWYRSEKNGAVLTALPGQQLTLPETKPVIVSATAVLDVMEAEGEPELVIDRPAIYAYRHSPADNDYSSFAAYGRRTGLTKYSFSLAGPRGDYDFRVYAYVQGSWTRFDASFFSIGTPVPVVAGSGTTVTLEDSSGNPLPATVTFDSITDPGIVAATLTDAGPRPPAGYELLEIAAGTPYLGVSNTAVIQGELEVTLTYDPQALGLTEEEEARLQLLSFSCDAEDHCAWKPITRPAMVTSAVGCGQANFANPDTVLHTISGRAQSLEVVALGLPDKPVAPPRVTCVGTPDAPVRLTVAPDTCGLAVDNVNQLAGGCFAGDLALASCTFVAENPLHLGLGSHAILVNAQTVTGSSASCVSYVSVEDGNAPHLQVSASPSNLWPPNHRLHPIMLDTRALDACDPTPAITCDAVSNEPDDGLGDGHTTGDIVWRDGVLYLRAERSGLGEGRRYTITCRARDGADNERAAVAHVTVSPP